MSGGQPLLKRPWAAVLTVICGSLFMPAAYALDAAPDPAKIITADPNSATNDLEPRRGDLGRGP